MIQISLLKVKAWISAARLRTLPLSISGIIMGTALAIRHDAFDKLTFVLAICTTLGLQVLSNFANDYGDGIKGTDNQERIGPMRALQSGLIQPGEMLRGIIITAVVTFLLALFLIYSAFGSENFLYSVIFFVLGIGAIVAAIKYTVGNSAYGYKGLGDVFVFVFFGWVSVVGVYFLYVKAIDWTLWLPASGIGLLCTAVLNLNNMRDQVNDANVGKNTLVVSLGAKRAKQYHYTLIFGSLLLFISYQWLKGQTIQSYMYLIAFIPLLLHVKNVAKNKIPKNLDPELKKVALSTFFLALIFLFQSSFW